MKKACEYKVGDTVIYNRNDNVKVSTIVPKPIDDGQTRPRFKIGRIDLANGDYLIGGEFVYESEEEAKTKLIDDLKNRIKAYEEEKLYTEGMLLVLNRKLKALAE